MLTVTPPTNTGCQPRDRRYGPGAADLKFDRLDDGQFFLRGKLLRNRPARCARDETQRLLVGDAVDLEHHAVDVIGKRGTPRADVCKIGRAGLETGHHPQFRRDRQPPFRSSAMQALWV